MDNDTDDDCILDGEEVIFAQSVMRSPSIAMISSDVDEDGVLDGEQYGCEPVDMAPVSSTMAPVSSTMGATKATRGVS